MDDIVPRDKLNELFGSWSSQTDTSRASWYPQFEDLIMSTLDEISAIYATPCDCGIFRGDVPTTTFQSIDAKCNAYKPLCEIRTSFPNRVSIGKL